LQQSSAQPPPVQHDFGRPDQQLSEPDGEGTRNHPRRIKAGTSLLFLEDKKAGYTTNMVCRENNCLNPIIPGLMLDGENVLEKNKQMVWSCANVQHTPELFRLGGFCSRIIASYPFSTPQASSDGSDGITSEFEAMRVQEKKALDTFIMQVSGMGFDFWDFTTPWAYNTPECIQAVWRMSCYTHFPRCNEGVVGEYLPPCRNECEDYLKRCSVECCDEGVQCHFTHARKLANGTTTYEHGYPNHKGPSPVCTGGDLAGARQIILGFSTLLPALFLAMHYC